MKIWYICPDHGIPVLGRKGCSTHVRETCRMLMDMGHEVTIFTPNRGEDERLNAGFNFRVVPCYKKKFLGSDLRLRLNNRHMRAALLKEFDVDPPDVIYERYSLYATAGRNFANRFGIPRILEANAHLVEEQADRLHFPWMAQRIENDLLRSADWVIVVSWPLKRSFVRLGIEEERIVVMPMAVDISRFHPEVKPHDLRSELGIEAKVMAGYVGTLTQWHGIDMVYDVAQRLKREEVDCAIVVIGGDERQVARHRERTEEENLTGRVVFTGSIPYSEVPAYLQAMDITFIPNSTSFASPTKLFEYQAMGKPSIAPRLEPIETAMTHEKEGLFFEPRSVSGLTECILRLVDDEELRRKIGAAARKKVVETHSWEVNCQRIIEMYNKMLDSDAPSAPGS